MKFPRAGFLIVLLAFLQVLAHRSPGVVQGIYPTSTTAPIPTSTTAPIPTATTRPIPTATTAPSSGGECSPGATSCDNYTRYTCPNGSWVASGACVWGCAGDGCAPDPNSAYCVNECNGCGAGTHIPHLFSAIVHHFGLAKQIWQNLCPSTKDWIRVSRCQRIY